MSNKQSLYSKLQIMNAELRLVSSYLLVAFDGCCPLFKIQAFQYGILSEALLDSELRFLHPPFLRQRSPFLPSLRLQSLIVGKQVELLGAFVLYDCPLVHNMADGQVKPADKQNFIDNAVKKVCDSIDDQSRR